MPGPPEDDLEKQAALFRARFLTARRKYETTLQELSVIKRLAQVLRGMTPDDRQETFWRLIQIIAGSFPDFRISLLLFDASRSRLERVAHSENGGPILHPETEPLDPALLERLMAGVTVRGGTGPDDEATPLHPQGLEIFTPLRHQTSIEGFLRLSRNESEPLPPQQHAFLDLITDQLTTATLFFRMYQRMLREERNRVHLSRFFSKSITREILSRKNLNLGGVRKEITILFADLKGFTAISERLDQETVVSILNAFFSTATPIVFRHNGTLDKIMGDALMAIFGAPLADPDSPIRGVAAAVEILGAIREFNTEQSHRGWPQLNLAIGINHGEAVAGFIGSEYHLNYTVIGDAVNVAQRLQTEAGANEIYISESVYRAAGPEIAGLEGIVRIDPLPPLQLKGRVQTITAYRILCR